MFTVMHVLEVRALLVDWLMRGLLCVLPIVRRRFLVVAKTTVLLILMEVVIGLCTSSKRQQSP